MLFVLKQSLAYFSPSFRNVSQQVVCYNWILFYRNKNVFLCYFYQNFLLICMAFHLRWVIFHLRWANFYSGRANYQLRWTFFKLRWTNFELRWTNFHSLWISFHLPWISFQNFNALIWKIIVTSQKLVASSDNLLYPIKKSTILVLLGYSWKIKTFKKCSLNILRIK